MSATDEGHEVAAGNERKIRAGPSDDHDETIRLTDKNGDGKLTVDEIIGLTRDALKHFEDVEFEENDKKIARHFGAADVNQDGFLDIGELPGFKRSYWSEEL